MRQERHVGGFKIGFVDRPVALESCRSALSSKAKISMGKGKEVASTESKGKEKAPSQAKSKRKTTESPTKGAPNKKLLALYRLQRVRRYSHLIFSSLSNVIRHGIYIDFLQFIFLSCKLVNQLRLGR